MAGHPAGGLDSITVWLGRVDGDARGHAHRLVIEAAAVTLGLPRAQLRLTTEPGGRPRVVIGAPGEPVPVYVALSHTRGAVAVAVSGLGPVGVDTERVRPLPSLALANRWLSEPEVRWLSGLAAAGQTVGFLLLWTQKEAVGKALGVGLRGGGMRREVPRLAGLGHGARPGRLRPVPGLPAISVAGWAERDLVLAVACDAPDARAATIAFRELEPPHSRAEGRSGEREE